MKVVGAAPPSRHAEIKGDVSAKKKTIFFRIREYEFLK